jgi:hypothetical protein
VLFLADMPVRAGVCISTYVSKRKMDFPGVDHTLVSVLYDLVSTRRKSLVDVIGVATGVQLTFILIGSVYLNDIIRSSGNRLKDRMDRRETLWGRGRLRRRRDHLDLIIAGDIVFDVSHVVRGKMARRCLLLGKPSGFRGHACVLD